MGGLIARRYLADNFSREQRSRVIPLICFATPHTGPELSSAIQFVQGNHEQIRNILAGSDFLISLDADWEKTLCARKIKCISVRGGKDIIVGEQSSQSMPESIPYTVAGRTHTSLAKPEDHNDAAYLIVTQEVNAVLRGGNEQLARARIALGEGDNLVLLSLIANNGKSWIETRDSGWLGACLKTLLVLATMIVESTSGRDIYLYLIIYSVTAKPLQLLSQTS